jgi:hypothetical protein
MDLYIQENTRGTTTLTDIDPVKFFTEGRALRRWGYRSCWPVNEAIVEDADNPRGDCSRTPLVAEAHRKWASECGRDPDNHSTFEVYLEGHGYIFACFHDGIILLGRKAVQGGSNPTWNTTCTDQERNERLASNAVRIEPGWNT